MFEKKPKIVSLETIGELCKSTKIGIQNQHHVKKLSKPVIEIVKTQDENLNKCSSEKEQLSKEDILWL